MDISHIEDKKYFDYLKVKFKNILKNQIQNIKCDHFQIAKFMSKSDLVVLLYEEQLEE